MSSRNLLQLSSQHSVWHVPSVTENYVVGVLPAAPEDSSESDSDAEPEHNWLEQPTKTRKATGADANAPVSWPDLTINNPVCLLSTILTVPVLITPTLIATMGS